MGGMMVTSKQSKTSTVTITGASFHFLFFFLMMRATRDFLREKTLSLLVVCVWTREPFIMYRIDLFYILTSVSFFS